MNDTPSDDSATQSWTDPDATVDGPGIEPDLPFLQPPTQPHSLGKLGHYDVFEVLGRGGFGIVLRAFDAVLQRIVAIKVLAPEMATTSSARQRFLQEARAAARIRHENVVQVYAVEEQPLPHIVMEFIPGETLQQRLERVGPLDAAEVVAIGRQVVDGLAAAHAVGLIHRDIKPANILLEDSAGLRAKITDFGLARAADDVRVTRSGTVVGTPMYMSPEQAQGHDLDHRTDLFSLGSLLYAITSGQPPFRANGTLAILKRVTEETPRPIPEIVPTTPMWLWRVIARLMAKDPADRYPTAKAVTEALAAPATTVASTASRNIRTRVLLLAGGILTVAAAVFLAHYFPRDRERPEGVVVNAIPLELPAKPPPAEAPFSSSEAQAHQKAWARYLGTEVDVPNSIDVHMVLIPPGEFRMGTAPKETDALQKRMRFIPKSDPYRHLFGEGPQRRIVLTKPFRIAAHPLTMDNYRRLMGADGVPTKGFASRGGNRIPVSLSWHEGAEFCNRLSEREGFTPCYEVMNGIATPIKGNGYRYPTEAEWEFACRAGTTTTYFSGDSELTLDPYIPARRNDPGPVGQLKPNAFGLYDIVGFVQAWCHDEYDLDYFRVLPERAFDPVGVLTTHVRPIRGGFHGDDAEVLRSSRRWAQVMTSGEYISPRLVRTLDIPP